MTAKEDEKVKNYYNVVIKTHPRIESSSPQVPLAQDI